MQQFGTLMPHPVLHRLGGGLSNQGSVKLTAYARLAPSAGNLARERTTRFKVSLPGFRDGSHVHDDPRCTASTSQYVAC